MTEDNDYWTSPDGIAQRIGLLCDTYTYKVYNGAIQIVGAKNLVYGFEWIGSTDERTCNRCDMNIGRIFTLGQFMADLPIHAHCLRPDILVHTNKGLVPVAHVHEGDYVLTHKLRYRKVTQIHKHTINAELYRLGDVWLTGNHRVFTPQGWIRTDDLQDFSMIYAFNVGADNQLALINSYSDKFPVTIRQNNFFAHILRTFCGAVMPITAVNFNSQLNFGNSKIDTVDFHRKLWNNFDFVLPENVEKLLFKRRQKRRLLSCQSFFNAFLSRTFLSSYSIMSCFYLTKSLLLRHFGPLQGFSVALSSNFGSCLNKSLSDCSSGNKKLFGDCKFRNSRIVKTDNLAYGQGDSGKSSVSLSSPHPLTPSTLNTDIIRYKGSVHNLTVDEDNSYVAGTTGIAVHNCRCEWRPILKR